MTSFAVQKLLLINDLSFLYQDLCWKLLKTIPKMFLANSVFKFFLVHFDEKLTRNLLFYKVVIIFFTTLIWRLQHHKMYFKTNCNSSSLIDKFIVQVSSNIMERFWIQSNIFS